MLALTLPRWNLATPLQRPPRAYFQGAPLLLLLIVILLVGCAPGPNQAASASVPHGSIAGFWLGLWHGMIAHGLPSLSRSSAIKLAFTKSTITVAGTTSDFCLGSAVLSVAVQQPHPDVNECDPVATQHHGMRRHRRKPG